ncbi:hypothetical protein INT44_007142 [Umbelopsis vinacea]|uniref:Velvet domain-containing protein n=1 Tax=Umbelopsis vinacea TaxID=44442 RepID=A0A8H7PHW6_9FUNG|nr:hypothetical protein INT44_007142 [Umbelopsis vinacea]
MQNSPNSRPSDYSWLRLMVRQQPVHARLCSFKEKVDRRPIDPPPIVQLVCNSPGMDQQQFLQNPFFFLVCSLQNANDYDTQGSRVDCNQTTAGTVVQSLHKLKDLDGSDGGFFLFSDISIRVEGYFRLRFTLFEIVGTRAVRLTSTLSDVFQVYSPKLFPGMAESTLLTRHLSDQGMRIRIRKENRVQLSKRKRSEDAGSVDDASCSQPPSPVTSNSHPSPPCVTPDRTPLNYPTATRSISPSENQVRLPPLKHLLQALPHPFTGSDSYYSLREPVPTAYQWPVAPGRSSAYYVGDP